MIGNWILPSVIRMTELRDACDSNSVELKQLINNYIVAAENAGLDDEGFIPEEILSSDVKITNHYILSTIGHLYLQSLIVLFYATHSGWHVNALEAKIAEIDQFIETAKNVHIATANMAYTLWQEDRNEFIYYRYINGFYNSCRIKSTHNSCPEALVYAEYILFRDFLVDKLNQIDRGNQLSLKLLFKSEANYIEVINLLHMNQVIDKNSMTWLKGTGNGNDSGGRIIWMAALSKVLSKFQLLKKFYTYEELMEAFVSTFNTKIGLRRFKETPDNNHIKMLEKILSKYKP